MDELSDSGIPGPRAIDPRIALILTTPVAALIAAMLVTVPNARAQDNVLTFRRDALAPVAQPTAQLPALQVSDIDGDEVPDLVATPWFLRGVASGGFAGAWESPSASALTRRWASGDADGDGDLDFLAVRVSGGGAAVSMFRNDGGGAFTEVTIAAEMGAGQTALDAGWIDLGGDGDLDPLVVVYESSNTAVLVPYENRLGTFVAQTGLPVPSHPRHTRTPVVRGARINADTRDDALIDGGWAFSTVLQAVDGTVSLAEIPYSPESVSKTPHAVLVDMDGDGDTDLFDGVFVLRNDGTGTFTKDAIGLGNDAYYGRYAVGDLTGDGLPDIAYVPATLLGEVSELRVGVNVGGRFPTATDATHTGLSLMFLDSPAAIDFDGDGRIDVIGLEGSPSGTPVVATRLGAPTPHDLAFEPSAIGRAGAHDVLVRGVALTAGATVTGDSSISAGSVSVASATEARVTLQVEPGAGGGTRELTWTNPDGQAARATLELRSISLAAKRGSLRLSPLPARDSLSLRGSLRPNSLAREATFRGVEDGLTLRVGPQAATFLLSIGPDDAGWTESADGRNATWRSADGAFPRVEFSVDRVKFTYSLRVLYADLPDDAAQRTGVRLVSGDEIGAAQAAWRRARGRGHYTIQR